MKHFEKGPLILTEKGRGAGPLSIGFKPCISWASRTSRFSKENKGFGWGAYTSRPVVYSEQPQFCRLSCNVQFDCTYYNGQYAFHD